VEAVRDFLVGWEVLEEGRDPEGRLRWFRATNATLPVVLLVMDLEDAVEDPDARVPAVRLAIETSVKTAYLDVEERLALYREMFDKAKIPLATFYLIGVHDEIVVAVDVDKRILTREVLEDHFRLLLAFFALASASERVWKQVSSESRRVLLKLVRKWLREGLGREELIEKLTAAGYPPEEAAELVDIILAVKREREAQEPILFI